jgi:hypothetical protein
LTRRANQWHYSTIAQFGSPMMLRIGLPADYRPKIPTARFGPEAEVSNSDRGQISLQGYCTSFAPTRRQGEAWCPA